MSRLCLSLAVVAVATVSARGQGLVTPFAGVPSPGGSLGSSVVGVPSPGGALYQSGATPYRPYFSRPYGLGGVGPFAGYYGYGGYSGYGYAPYFAPAPQVYVLPVVQLQPPPAPVMRPVVPGWGVIPHDGVPREITPLANVAPAGGVMRPVGNAAIPLTGDAGAVPPSERSYDLSRTAPDLLPKK
jgi:hypothetical protein